MNSDLDSTALTTQEVSFCKQTEDYNIHLHKR